MRSSRPIRVLFCMPGLDGGGAERITLQLANGLDSTRFSPEILCFYRRGELLGGDLGKVPIRFVLPGRLPERRDWLGLSRACLGQVRRADIVIGTQEGAATALPLALSVPLMKRFIAWVHIDWSAFAHQVTRMRRWSLRAYPLCDRVVTVSDGLRQNVLRRTSASPSKVITIPNGSAIADIAAKSREALGPELAKAFERPTIVACGRLSPQKSFQHLIQAHHQVLRSGLECNLVILGEGELRSSLEALVAELGNQQSVFMPGFVRNPYAVIARAHVFALSSFAEGHPLVLIEALACGAPIVSTDCPSGPREILDDGRAGMLVPVADVDALANALLRMLTDSEHRARFAAAARARAELYGLGKCIDTWSSLLEQLAP